MDFCEAPYQCAVENCADIVMFLLQRVKLIVLSNENESNKYFFKKVLQFL